MAVRVDFGGVMGSEATQLFGGGGEGGDTVLKRIMSGGLALRAAAGVGPPKDGALI